MAWFDGTGTGYRLRWADAIHAVTAADSVMRCTFMTSALIEHLEVGGQTGESAADARGCNNGV